MQKTYIVKRYHIGDQPYNEGDERVADDFTVRHLVAKGVLVEKAAPKPLNKAGKPMKNKAR